MSAHDAGGIISMLFMSFALGMDAFSVSLGLGMQQIRLKRIALIGFVVGIFHIIMPFVGIIVGKLISTQIGQLTTFLAGMLLIAIGSQMVFSAFNHEVRKIVKPAGIGLIVFAVGVSMDGFSVGLSLGMSGVQFIVALFMFGTISMFLTWTGLILGRKVRGLLGVYGEIMGGSILCGFGLHMLFG